MLRKTLLSAALALAAALTALPPADALADQAKIRRVVESKLNGAKVGPITKLPNADLYEVAFETRGGWQLVYTDRDANYIVFGQELGLLDTRSDRDLAEERINKLTMVPFADLPFDQAFKIVRGKGTRQMAYFGDPNCRYCKELDQHIAKLDDVTVHLFLYPVLGPNSVEKSRAVWCSQDRAKAWMDMMLRNVMPTANGDCATPVEKNVALGQRLRINGTPTMFFENGQRVSGYRPAEQLTKLLDQTKSK
ncbi:MAG: DsbC family protein [Burkholderiales bacterium]|nr:DsbC family protein [Burkholderiales bacterium]